LRRVGIVGAGVAGSVAANLLLGIVDDVDVFDMYSSYVKPCGEVVPSSTLPLVRSRRLPVPEIVDRIRVFEFYDEEGRLLRRVEYPEPLWLSIDKSGWVNNMREGVGVVRRAVKPSRLNGYDLVVDARGPFASHGNRITVWRAYAATRDFEGRAAVVISSHPFGIAWLFGHGDAANVGGGFFGVPNPKRLAEKLIRRLSSAALHGDAYSLVTLYPRLRLHREAHVLAVGEAAGFVQSLGGEGIRPAIESAALLADTVAEAGSAGFGQVLDTYALKTRGLMVETRVSSLLLSLARAAGPSLMKRVSRGFIDLWLSGRLREARRVLSRLYLVKNA